LLSISFSLLMRFLNAILCDLHYHTVWAKLLFFVRGEVTILHCVKGDQPVWKVFRVCPNFSITTAVPSYGTIPVCRYIEQHMVDSRLRTASIRTFTLSQHTILIFSGNSIYTECMGTSFLYIAMGLKLCCLCQECYYFERHSSANTRFQMQAHLI